MENIEKRIEKSKEITDLQNEIKKIQHLLSEGQWDKLKNCLYDISGKHFAEKALYNAINTNLPKTIQENPTNCINFLNQLIESKIAKNIHDEIKE